MRKNLIIVGLLVAAALIIFYPSFSNFFAQDDFVLINNFSQQGTLQNLSNVFGPPLVTHWRPVHNLFFMTGGALFGKNYFLYHLLLFLFLVGSGFFICKVVSKIAKNDNVGTISGLIYVMHPAHFNSLFWISGGATLIGFFFLIASFNCYLLRKNVLSFVLFILALFASEAMVVGAAIFIAHRLLFPERAKRVEGMDKFIVGILISSFTFLAIKFLFLTPKSTYDAYKIIVSPADLTAVKYYTLRVMSFPEGFRLKYDLLLAGWVLTAGFLAVKNDSFRKVFFPAFVIMMGMFPFILIPNHLSPNYMNISVWGFAMIAGLAFTKLQKPIILATVLFFAVMSFINVREQMKNSWVIQRANLAKTYIHQTEMANLPRGSTIVFADSGVSTSQEAYYSLGTGDAIKFWFPDKNYKTCFTFYENCKKD